MYLTHLFTQIFLIYHTCCMYSCLCTSTDIPGYNKDHSSFHVATIGVETDFQDLACSTPYASVFIPTLEFACAQNHATYTFVIANSTREFCQKHPRIHQMNEHRTTRTTKHTKSTSKLKLLDLYSFCKLSSMSVIILLHTWFCRLGP